MNRQPGRYWCDHCEEPAGAVCRRCRKPARFIPRQPVRAERAAEWFSLMRQQVATATDFSIVNRKS